MILVVGLHSVGVGVGVCYSSWHIRCVEKWGDVDV